MATYTAKDTNPSYWKEYSNLQHVKHSIIENYLNGWLPKLGRWSGRICYFDTHAGRGRHKGGQKGSPLIALNCILNHRLLKSHLKNCEIVFFFIEADKNNCCALETEIESVKPLPQHIKVEIIPENCFDALQKLTQHLNESGSSLAPAFIFVDPYGFKIPGEILRQLMNFQRVELFINIIWRELSMAIAQGNDSKGMSSALDMIFEGDCWRQLVGLPFDEQADACVNLLRENIGAKWATHIRMLGKNGATRYMLMHLTNHDSGRDLMKDCIWKVCPEGGYFARVKDNPRQQFLIEPTPDLKPLKQWLVDQLTIAPLKWQDLIEKLRAEVWRVPQLNQVVRDLRNARVIDGRYYQSKFSPKNNPELFLL